jgi:hypothetical protein
MLTDPGLHQPTFFKPTITKPTLNNQVSKNMISRSINNRVRRLVMLLVPVIAVTMLAACSITAPRNNEGYANLDSPGMLDTDRTVSLSIGSTLLRFAANHMDDEPETKALLKGLDGVRIRTYEIDGDPERVARNLERMGQKLQNDDWQPVMLVQDDGDKVQMYAKSSSRGIQGLTLITSDDSEVVVINLMGDIKPSQFQNVMVALDVNDTPEVQVVLDAEAAPELRVVSATR